MELGLALGDFRAVFPSTHLTRSNFLTEETQGDKSRALKFGESFNGMRRRSCHITRSRELPLDVTFKNVRKCMELIQTGR